MAESFGAPVIDPAGNARSSSSPTVAPGRRCPETVLTSWTEHWQLVLGPILLLVVLFTQGGLTGLFNRLGLGGRSAP